MSHIAIDARIISSSTGTYVERLLHYLQQIDSVNVYTILVLNKDKDFWRPSAANFSVKVADFKNYSLSEQIGFKKLLDDLAPDLVHFCMPQQPVLYRSKHITTIHDLTLLKVYNSDKNWLIYHTKQLIGRFVFAHVISSSTHIITPSNYTMQSVIEFSRRAKGKTSVIYESADPAPTQVEKYDSPFQDFILYVGQQSDYKNIRRLGDAHQKLLEKHPNLGLILVGKKNASALKNEAYFASKKYRNILFTGFLPNSQRDWLYTRAKAYIFPSLMEGFGLPGLEAMGYGAPVISSNATCLPEIYGDAALYFDPLNTLDMTNTIEKVISSEKLRNQLIKKGHQQLKKYSWLHMAKETHQLYIDALNKK
jgi:glycosyltransferase involved in cell wall biosynthesis